MHARTSLVPRPFLYGRGERGEGRKGLVNNSTPTRIYGISIIVSCEATNTYKFIVPQFKREAMCQHYTFTQNSFMTHTYLTFAFSLINTDGRNAAVDPRWGRVIHQTLPSLSRPTHTGRVWEPNYARTVCTRRSLRFSSA